MVKREKPYMSTAYNRFEKKLVGSRTISGSLCVQKKLTLVDLARKRRFIVPTYNFLILISQTYNATLLSVHHPFWCICKFQMNKLDLKLSLSKMGLDCVTRHTMNILHLSLQSRREYIQACWHQTVSTFFFSHRWIFISSSVGIQCTWQYVLTWNLTYGTSRAITTL